MNTRSVWKTLLALCLGIGLWTAGSVWTVAGIEEAKYSVIKQMPDYELRRYEPALIAQTSMPTMSSADRGAAFRAIAGYIFGGNTRKDKIAMTAPVVMDAPSASEKIAMTAPVVMGRDAAGTGSMAFVLPSKYKTLADLPQPNDPRVTLRVVDARTVAALRFTWYAGDVRFAEKSAILQAALTLDGVTAVSPPYLASYDPPFSAPFLKRHEVLIDVQEK
jgi:hypothetical protein